MKRLIIFAIILFGAIIYGQTNNPVFTQRQRNEIKDTLNVERAARKTVDDSLANSITLRANTALNNLGTTSINSDLIPGTNNIRKLGSLTKAWDELFLNKWILPNGDYGVYVYLPLTSESDKYITFQDKSGTVMLTSDTTSLSNRIDAIQAGSGGANVTLSNLSPTFINRDLNPSGTLSLGALATPWNESYIQTGRFNTVKLGAFHSNVGTLTSAGLTTNRTWTFPNATGTVMLTSDTTSLSNRIDNIVVGTGANKTLSNLTAGVSINLSLTPDLNATRNLGSSSKQWLELYSGYWLNKIGSYTTAVGMLTPTSNRYINFPDANGTVALTSDFKTGTDSIHYGQDSIVVIHGVGSTPSFVSIQLTSNSFGFPIWVNTIGSTTFAVKRSNIGLETITSYIKFKWMAYK